MELGDHQNVEWVCATYKDDHMIYVLKIKDGKSKPEFIAAYTSDRGVLVSRIGPQPTLTAIKKKVGRAPEGWT